MTDLVDEYGYPDKLREQANNSHERWGPQLAKEHEPRRNTDYDFPRGWGKLSDEEKCTWFVKQREYRQAWRQWDAGVMMQGLSDDEMSEGKTAIEAVSELENNPFKW